MATYRVPIQRGIVGYGRCPPFCTVRRTDRQNSRSHGVTTRTIPINGFTTEFYPQGAKTTGHRTGSWARSMPKAS